MRLYLKLNRCISTERQKTTVHTGGRLAVTNEWATPYLSISEAQLCTTALPRADQVTCGYLILQRVHTDCQRIWFFNDSTAQGNNLSNISPGLCTALKQHSLISSVSGNCAPPVLRQVLVHRHGRMRRLTNPCHKAWSSVHLSAYRSTSYSLVEGCLLFF